MEFNSFYEQDKASSAGRIGVGDSYELSPSCGNICDCACFCNCFGDYTPSNFEEGIAISGGLESTVKEE